ncbi:MAG TPA: malto-oligosyltrehalose synthase [Devosiaceae bacterium]|jgi:(1->4)-alpha-D-glucan 1-alpha-D-glucosylmutase|nr:malto-oligosyltrehalose synthase [Devosiaceae bacterium]
MTTPTATYRLQFRNGMTFERAAELVPYLHQLGASHLYASPIFAATTGSTHGYDVVDHNRLDPALGGEEGFARLAEALRSAGLGLVLDIVPNHMGANPDNPWWRSVLEWGEASPYARHFDINWQEKLTLPVLGQPLEQCLADGAIGLGIDDAGFLGLSAGGAVMPIAPATYREVLAPLEHPLADAIAELAAEATPASAEELHDRVRSLFGKEGRDTFEAELDRLAEDRALVETVHAAQAWQLTFWRDARRHLSYRRFFEVTGLAGVRVEDEHVFEDVHRLTLRLVADGIADGLRVDHVDGLANPRQYLDRLRRAAGDETWLVVEKILEAEETLPADWPVAGTTGYEFIAAIAAVLVDADKADALEDVYAATAQPAAEFEAERRSAKLQILCHNLETELTGLVQLAGKVAAAENVTASPDQLRGAIVELIVALPVYRLYGEENGLPESDQRLLESVLAAVRSDAPDLDPSALELVVRMLKQEVGAAADVAREFQRRLQQTSGPVMAKALEDTLFYRRNRLLALNEVGGDPENRDGSLEAFHEKMAARVERQPEGLLATATHDTKRGEDARARLYAISEAPELWGESVARWRAMQAPLRRELERGLVPDAETEWMVFQALAGVWPLRPDSASLEDLRERFAGYLEKAMREAKTGTDWTDVNEGYERAVQDYASNLLAPGKGAFLDDFTRTLRPFCRAGALNSLTQTVLKLTAPGIPDIYQGTEGWDFSLVDPDNRRPVDFTGLAAKLGGSGAASAAELLADWRSGRIKQHLIRRGLALRSQHPQLLTTGTYSELPVAGTRGRHLIAFCRSNGSGFALVVVPRLTMGLLGEGDDIALPPEVWTDTAIAVPSAIVGRRCRNALTDEVLELPASIPVGELLGSLPLAVLVPAVEEAAQPA